MLLDNRQIQAPHTKYIPKVQNSTPVCISLVNDRSDVVNHKRVQSVLMHPMYPHHCTPKCLILSVPYTAESPHETEG